MRLALCTPVSAIGVVGWLAAPRDAEFQTTVEWHPSQVVGYREATWFGAVLYSAWWQVAHVVGVPTNCIWPCELGLWQAMQSTARWPPVSGKRVSWCALVIAVWSPKLRFVWQRAQFGPSSPRCRSVWQAVQSELVRWKSSVAWHARQVVAPCAPVSGNPKSAWSNWLLICSDVQLSGRWQTAHSVFRSPWGDVVRSCAASGAATKRARHTIMRRFIGTPCRGTSRTSPRAGRRSPTPGPWRPAGARGTARTAPSRGRP